VQIRPCIFAKFLKTRDGTVQVGTVQFVAILALDGLSFGEVILLDQIELCFPGFRSIDEHRVLNVLWHHCIHDIVCHSRFFKLMVQHLNLILKESNFFLFGLELRSALTVKVLLDLGSEVFRKVAIKSLLNCRENVGQLVELRVNQELRNFDRAQIVRRRAGVTACRP